MVPEGLKYIHVHPSSFFMELKWVSKNISKIKTTRFFCPIPVVIEFDTQWEEGPKVNNKKFHLKN